MSDRREPTISGLRVDTDDPRLRKHSEAQASASSSSAGAASKRPKNTAGNTTSSATGNTTAQTRKVSAPPVRPVIVRSKLAPVALIFALLAAGAAGGLAWLFFEAQKQLVDAETRIAALEEKLVMSDDESTASLAALQASLKEAHSEIRKLWGVSYDRNRKSIETNNNAIASVKSQGSKNSTRLESLSTQITLISDLVDAQQTALTEVEKSNASVSAQARAMNEKNAIIDQRVAELRSQIDVIEQDIEAINGFRRSVNQELLQLRGATRSAP